MPKAAYVLGVDAGGTSTRCLAVALDGNLIGVAEGGPGNVYSVGVAGLAQLVADLVGQAAGAGREPAAVLCLGAAGVGRAEEEKWVQAALAPLGLAKELIVENDGIISLAAGTLGGPGVAVIAGTGSIAVGMSADGRRARSGGWGYLLGDEGSGYDVARKALMAILRAHDGRSPATALQPELLKALRLKSPEQLIDFVYGQSLKKEEIAALAPIVLRLAEQDETAAAIAADAAQELACLAQAAHRQLSLPATATVVVAGGMFKSPLLHKLFVQALRQRLPKANVTQAPWPTALGAVFLALRRAGINLSRQEACALANQINALKG